jgi:shikimate 5-dehydrogenase
MGRDDLFVPLEVASREELEALLRPLGEGCLDELGFTVAGFAVTMPWKSAALGCCSVVAPRAERARAVNTVLPRRGKVLGDCTDIDGVTRALREAGVTLAGARVLVLGAGGSARAAAVSLEMAGADVAILARYPVKAAALGRSLGVGVLTGDATTAFTVVVNATPLGGDGAPAEMLEGLHLKAGSVALDLPYGETPTGLEILAARRGWQYVSGRQVLLWQGVAQLAAMTGEAPPVAAMAAALGITE